ncbi:hypothetical protein NOS3756_21900 [Nostoc sp. NIES-3756]|uniref:hypothetical protein n=1 Tax=Nostoc sp. NIES-3756 TaxID=1751286 RepID=UPI0007204BC0|nr:hypothetical protein [Nostoc sp. NIES-3756]BAT53231.1 hypothetical protein NOS3756_21900 [Nostoc sp. NIES-3756]BAY39040.1 hypothetical protein NIES2111_33900 [Nostoc sp. NIES-2111]
MQDDITCLQSQGREMPNSTVFRHNYGWKILHNIWQKLVKIIILNPQEIQVKQKVDRYGNQYWYAYDPITGKSFTSGSQADISMWIEQVHRSY